MSSDSAAVIPKQGSKGRNSTHGGISKSKITAFPALVNCPWTSSKTTAERKAAFYRYLSSVMLPSSGVLCPHCDYTTHNKADMAKHFDHRHAEVPQTSSCSPSKEKDS